MARPKKEENQNEDFAQDVAEHSEQVRRTTKPQSSNMRVYEQWPVKVKWRTEFDANKNKVSIPTVSKKGNEPIRSCNMERSHAQTLNTTSLSAKNAHRYYDKETGEVPVMADEQGNPLMWEDYE